MVSDPLSRASDVGVVSHLSDRRPTSGPGAGPAEFGSGASHHFERFERACASGKAIYLSTPITTGPRLLAWRKANPVVAASDPYATELRREVIAENIRALRPLRARIARTFEGRPLIDPTDIDEPGWTQVEYHQFWVEVIRRYASEVVFADGWQYSTGCGFEFATAGGQGLGLLDSDLQPLSISHAVDLLTRASEELEQAGMPTAGAEAALAVARERRAPNSVVGDRASRPLKDEVLARLAESHNVALFASFAPGQARMRFSNVQWSGDAPTDAGLAVDMLMARSRDRSLNIRSFRETESKGSPFIYGLTSASEVLARVRELAAQGYFTIVNETIDVADGGVSGVRLGGLVEFAPDTTPRGVEGADVARMPLTLANQLLSAVYGIPIDIPGGADERIEFSVHPVSAGHRKTHICVWEAEEVPAQPFDAVVRWPNDFSRLIGDKTFGILLAHLVGVSVPYAQVVTRRVAPFAFGDRTATGEWWIRTAPREQEPGHFSTRRGWADPFELLAKEDPEGKRIAAVIAQEAVAALYSGATYPGHGEADIVEGVRGEGDRFMLGESGPESLPDYVVQAVRAVLMRLRKALGPARIEWAFDGSVVWVLQLHHIRDDVSLALNNGTAGSWVEFDPSAGLDALRKLIAQIAGSDVGVIVRGRVGVTSHVGDLLRKSGVPARFEPWALDPNSGS